MARSIDPSTGPAGARKGEEGDRWGWRHRCVCARGGSPVRGQQPPDCPAHHAEGPGIHLQPEAAPREGPSPSPGRAGLALMFGPSSAASLMVSLGWWLPWQGRPWPGPEGSAFVQSPGLTVPASVCSPLSSLPWMPLLWKSQAEAGERAGGLLVPNLSRRARAA